MASTQGQALATASPTPTVTPTAQAVVKTAVASPPAASTPIALTGQYLTTKDQPNAPTIIIDQSGKEVVLHGLGVYGFNTG